MKKILCVLFAMCTVFTAMAKSVKDNKVAELYDRMELKTWWIPSPYLLTKRTRRRRNGSLPRMPWWILT